MPGKLSEGDTISTGEHLSLVAKKRGGRQDASRFTTRRIRVRATDQALLSDPQRSSRRPERAT